MWRDALEVEPVARTRDMAPVVASAVAVPTSAHVHASNGTATLRLVRETEPAVPAIAAAHRVLEPAEVVEVECEGETAT